jgi:nitrogen regulatory protein P-II 1
MSYLVVLIVDDPEDCLRVIDRWSELGVTGATILDSTGMGRIKKAGMREDFPLIPSLQDFLAVREEPHRTILSVVEDETLVDKMAEVARHIIGDLDEPHTGFLFVVPVLKAYGLGRSS